MANWVTCFDNARYEVSDEGEVRNVKTRQILKPYLVKGYYRISLYAGKKRRHHLINRLVLISFVGYAADPKKNQSAHRDGDQKNNSLDNLVWKDWAGNYEDRLLHGTSTRKLSDDDVSLMRNQYANGQTQRALAIRFNIDRSTVSRIVNGHRYKN